MRDSLLLVVFARGLVSVACNELGETLLVQVRSIPMQMLILTWLATILLAGSGSLSSLAKSYDSASSIERDELRVDFVTSEDGAIRLQIRGIDIEKLKSVEALELAEHVTVYTRKGREVSSTPLFGELQRRDGWLEFVPRFPFRPGMEYRVEIHELFGGKQFDLALPKKARQSPLTTVVGVFPSQDSLPENLLKFYVQFSQPMSRGEVYQYAKVLDAKGQVIELAFLEIDEELWDPNHTRITLLFDPGRIKRELRPREEIGSPLREGNAYTLVIDKAWQDASGQELALEYRKEFRVSEHDATCPDPATWKISSPKSQSTEPVVVEFDEALDRAMLEHDLEVLDRDGKVVPGTIEVSQHETTWQFVPEEPWQIGEYRLRVATRLEDRAGNSIHKPFEVDLTRPFQSKYPETFCYLKFAPSNDR